ncbi:MAG: extracellular solute-binding protein [Chitinivibrionales bacterium]|nr:extracellular solute-binding protein [Chitinivibrionales bacterium]MBD3355905.1 extracellular solute-binding protein [Chitinivibrionales bacterium]
MRSCRIWLWGCFLGMAGIMLQCAPSGRMSVLIHMIDAQEAYFSGELLPTFGKEKEYAMEVVHYEDVDSIDAELERYEGEIALVKVPFDKAWSLVSKGLIKPLGSVLTDKELRDLHDTYLLTSLGGIEGKQYYIPRKLETRIMVYRKSKVAEAIAAWGKHVEAIGEDLKKYNGYGLPASYVLEEDPNKWDFYDVFVVGWVWAHTSYDGETVGRVAHRGKRYSGTALRVIDRVYQCGGDSADVLDMTGEAVVDAFHWEAVYASAGIYNERMWKEAWSGVGVWRGFKDGGVFLSFMTQLDCFFIHGTGRDGLDGYLDDPDDMGVAVMPRGVSLELDAEGNVVRRGVRAITTGGWWWGIPHDTPNPRASYELARHITDMENQVQGCSRFGMIPVRKEILNDISVLFGGGWITNVYDVSLKQLMNNKYTVLPYNPDFDDIRNLYLDAWFEIVAQGQGAAAEKIPDREHIKSILESKYAEAAKQYL